MRFEHRERGEYVELVWFGVRRGRLGESRPRPFEPLADAAAEANLVAALSREGFVDAGAADRWDFSTNPALEAAVRRDDPTAWLAWAEWLAGHGQPELAALLRHGPPARNNAFAYQWFGDLHSWLRALDKDWRRLPRELQLVSDADPAELAKVLSWPLCRFLERVDLCFDDHEETMPVLLGWPGLEHLRSLALWTDEEYGVDLPDLSALWPRARHLRSLAVVGGSDDGCLGELELPALEHLARRSERLSERELSSLLAARTPRLEALTIGVGRKAGDVTAESFGPLLSGERFPSLKKLAVTQFGAADELVELLATSHLLPRLTHLSLAQSSLTARGATVLARHAASFAHLEVLDVLETSLTEEEGAALFDALPVVGEHNAFLAPDEEPYLLKNYQTRFWEPPPSK